MKKISKILSTAVIAGVAGLTLASCNGNGGTKQAKILLGLQQKGDANTLAVESILDSLKDELNFTYEEVLLNSRDSVANLNTYNEKLSMGFNGIISMADLDAAQAKELIQNCEDAGCYYIGYKQEMTNAMATPEVRDSEYFLGGVTDGEYDWGLRGESLFNAISASTDRKIVLASFAPNFFPKVTDALTRFKTLVTQWNTTHPDDQFTYGEYSDHSDTWTCKFGPLADTEKANLKAQNVDAIVAVNSVAKYIMPNLDPSVHLYNVGYDSTYDAQFGEDKQLRCEGSAPADSIILPLMRIINAVNGADPIPVDEKIAVGNYIYFTKASQLTAAKTKLITMDSQHSFANALFTLEQAKALVGAPDKDLVALVESWTNDYVLNKLK